MGILTFENFKRMYLIVEMSKIINTHVMWPIIWSKFCSEWNYKPAKRELTKETKKDALQLFHHIESTEIRTPSKPYQYILLFLSNVSTKLTRWEVLSIETQRETVTSLMPSTYSRNHNLVPPFQVPLVK